jgi:RHS repeat-associated protein
MYTAPQRYRMAQIAGQRLNMGGASAYIDHADVIGSTTMETDPAGGVQWKIAYYPWGQILAQGGIRQSVVWAGLDWQVNDPSYPSATREYNDGLGRWLTPDPDGGHLENPQTLNKYVYAGNNPTSVNDPSGRDFYLACTHADDNSNSSTCQQVQNGSNTVWVQGTTDENGKFSATVISGGLSGLYDQQGNYYSGTFDQSGVHFEDESGTVSGGGVFKQGSPETDLLGSGLYAGTEGEFIDACGGLCPALGRLSDWQPGAVGQAESQMSRLNEVEVMFDLLSGAHDQSDQWRDSSGLGHVLRYKRGPNTGKTELHFEQSPVKGFSVVPHLGQSIMGILSGRAARQREVILP